MSISSSVIGSNGKEAEPLWDNAEFFWAHVVTSFAEKEKTNNVSITLLQLQGKGLFFFCYLTSWRDKTHFAEIG